MPSCRLQSELPADALAVDLVEWVGVGARRRNRHLEIARLKTYVGELLDRRRIHDLVEHSQYARQQLLKKSSGISVHATWNELFDTPRRIATKRGESGEQLGLVGAWQPYKRPVALSAHCDSESGQRLTVDRVS